MIFEEIAVGPLSVNCFIIGCEKNRVGIVVDPGGNVDAICEIVQKHALKIQIVVNTHGHFDHVGGNRATVTAFGARLRIHQADAALLGRAADIAGKYGLQGENSPPADEYLNDGDEIMVGEYLFKILHTPGHTQGGCCLYCATEKKIITGDTLFADSIGRTDLPGGSHEQLLASIRSKLFTLPDDVVVYPGHGQETTIGHEKRHNPYL